MKFTVVFTVFLLIIIGFIILNKSPNDNQSKGEQLVNSLLARTTEIIKKKYDIKSCGAGAAMPGGPIQELTLCFDTKVFYSKEQLRELLIKLSQELLSQVSADQEIQVHLGNEYLLLCKLYNLNLKYSISLNP